jgi:hypothetical protein
MLIEITEVQVLCTRHMQGVQTKHRLITSKFNLAAKLSKLTLYGPALLSGNIHL